MVNDTFLIKTTGFEGPFGLLLDLVEKRKLFIGDVSLASVTEDYLNYMNRLGGLPPSEISSFVVVAATLILIKSKSLLPNLSLTKEEEGDIQSLEERLRLYEIFTRLGENVKNDFGRQMIFAPLERKNEVLVFLPDDRITKNSMMEFARGVLDGMPKKVSLPEVEVKKVISIEEMLDKLTERIKDTLQVNFKEFAGRGKGGREEKVVMIVGFLAMLELVRKGIIHATQEDDGGDILLQKREPEENYELEITN